MKNNGYRSDKYKRVTINVGILEASTKQCVHFVAVNYRDIVRIDNLSRPSFVAFVVTASAFYCFLKSVEFIFYRSLVSHGFVFIHDLILPQKGTRDAHS
jgi:hypothetical protein